MVAHYNKIQSQVATNDIEILCFIDNKKRSIGYKRDALVQIAKGDYLTFIDDDDSVNDNYVNSIMTAICSNKDVDIISVKMTASINDGNPFVVEHDVNYEDEAVKLIDGVWADVKRKPLHTSVWKSSIAKSESFPDISYGEDGQWAKKLYPKIKTQFKMKEIISHYSYNEKITEAEYDG